MRDTQVKLRFKAIEDRLDKLEGKKEVVIPKLPVSKEPVKEKIKELGKKIEEEMKLKNGNSIVNVKAEEPVKAMEKPKTIVTKTSDIKGKEVGKKEES